MHKKKRPFGIDRFYKPTNNDKNDSPFNRHSRIKKLPFAHGEKITCCLVKNDYMIEWDYCYDDQLIKYLDKLPEDPTIDELNLWQNEARINGFESKYLNVSLIKVLEDNNIYKVLDFKFTDKPECYLVNEYDKKGNKLKFQELNRCI